MASLMGPTRQCEGINRFGKQCQRRTRGQYCSSHLYVERDTLPCVVQSDCSSNSSSDEYCPPSGMQFTKYIKRYHTRSSAVSESEAPPPVLDTPMAQPPRKIYPQSAPAVYEIPATPRLCAPIVSPPEDQITPPVVKRRLFNTPAESTILRAPMKTHSTQRRIARKRRIIVTQPPLIEEVPDNGSRGCLCCWCLWWIFALWNSVFLLCVALCALHVYVIPLDKLCESIPWDVVWGFSIGTVGVFIIKRCTTDQNRILEEKLVEVYTLLEEHLGDIVTVRHIRDVIQVSDWMWSNILARLVEDECVLRSMHMVNNAQEPCLRFYTSD